MNEATRQATIPPAGNATRRTALLGTIAATLAGDGMTIAAAPSPDAELIRCCADLIGIERRRNAMLDAVTNYAEEQAIQPQIDVLNERWWGAFAKIGELPPSTIAGAAALARACLVSAPRSVDGAIEIDGCSDEMAYMLVEWLAKQGGVA